MHPLIRAVPSLLGPITAGPPLTGIRLVVPLPPFLAGHGARIEIGFERGHLVFRLVRPGPPPGQPAWTDPSWSDPDDDVGRHDAWARF